MKVRCIHANKTTAKLTEGKIYEGELKFCDSVKEKRWDIKGFKDWNFKEDRFEEVKELTFKEVIANIREGEVWECVDKDIRIEEIFINTMGNLHLQGGCEFSRNNGTCIKLNAKFKLKRKEYTFEEAFKAYEEGKEIESVEGIKYRKKDEESIYVTDYDGNTTLDLNEDGIFSITEIKGEWYINE